MATCASVPGKAFFSVNSMGRAAARRGWQSRRRIEGVIMERMNPTPAEPIQYARLSNGIVIIRVSGRGTHLQSPALRHVFEQTRTSQAPPQYVIDLQDCVSMDSTFMGTLASIGLY